MSPRTCTCVYDECTSVFTICWWIATNFFCFGEWLLQKWICRSDCRDCASGFFGAECKRTCEPCLNDGHCDSGLMGTGKCICPEGFDPDTRCATCLPGFFGEKCKRCPDCNFPHGNCDDGLMGSGRCSCAVGFDADNNCMECMGSFFGPTCQPCKPCDGGKCNYGLLGDGECVFGRVFVGVSMS